MPYKIADITNAEVVSEKLTRYRNLCGCVRNDSLVHGAGKAIVSVPAAQQLLKDEGPERGAGPSTIGALFDV